MKSLQNIAAVIIIATVAAPIASFAQSNSVVSRQQVRSELVSLEKAGYNPAGVNKSYPADVEHAQLRINAAQGGFNSAGSGSSGTSQMGHPSVSKSDWNSMYMR